MEYRTGHWPLRPVILSLQKDHGRPAHHTGFKQDAVRLIAERRLFGRAGFLVLNARESQDSPALFRHSDYRWWLQLEDIE